MSRSHKANHYGTLIERKAAERYDLDLDRCSWHDAKRPDGTPVEIKGAMYQHADGQYGTFKLYQKYHRQLRVKDGLYVFAVYRVRGMGIEILDWSVHHPSNLPRLNWHGGGGHRGTKQTKIPIVQLTS